MAEIVLSDGKNVEISTVLLNKEQNINVGKTYVATVKKAVSKVSEDFYKLEEPKKEESASSQIFEAMRDDVFASPVVTSEVITEEPVVTAADKDEVVSSEMPRVEPILPTIPVSDVSAENASVKTEDNKSLPNIEPKKEVLPIQNSLASDIKPNVEPVVAPEPILPDINIDNDNVVELPKVSNVAETTSITNITEPEPKLAVEPILPVQPEIKMEPVVTPEPILPAKPTVDQTALESKLFFDGSKETNLNMALGEVSEEKTMTTEGEGVQALRQFGSDEPVVAPQEIMPEHENVKTLTRSKGFANNKFFMVVAILFFVAACVFLGYEAFQYFKIK